MRLFNNRIVDVHKRKKRREKFSNLARVIAVFPPHIFQTVSVKILFLLFRRLFLIVKIKITTRFPQ